MKQSPLPTGSIDFTLGDGNSPEISPATAIPLSPKVTITFLGPSLLIYLAAAISEPFLIVRLRIASASCKFGVKKSTN